MTFSALISFASLTFSHFVKQNLHTLKSCLQLLSHPWLKLNACLMQKCNTKIQHMLSAAERAHSKSFVDLKLIKKICAK